MNRAYRIFSLLLLSAYTLFLLHDLIPHTHAHSVAEGAEFFHHNSEGDHSHETHHDQVLVDLSLTADQAFKAHNSEEGTHHHDLAYRLNQKSKRLGQDAALSVLSLKAAFFELNPIAITFTEILSLLSHGHDTGHISLRAPPSHT